MNVLITGASGQLGSEIFHESKKSSHTFFFEDSKGLDITNSLEVGRYITKNNIDFVINCAAYTAVDNAEEDQFRAIEVNAVGVKNIVEGLKDRGKMIHVSTDYVFSGNGNVPFKENDEVDPVNFYGVSKQKGEEYFLNSNIEGTIIRVSWLYSCFGKNFVKTMLRLGKEKDNINVVSDQIGSPTYAKDLAKLCILMLDKNLDKDCKIYHYSNEGAISWYEFAREIMIIANLSCKVNPIETKDYPTLAKRPYFSVMNTDKIKEDFNIDIPFWKDSLEECIKNCKE
ncbi:dTDP-4-dehydrorhamnose reductase [Tenacibaculum sp. MEBiC06402]|uniref:dTDP-4-dehydrorhamnose reductase n=1 Tax=unclassified Tenacibaculum TaxID=2635139 RepID=UPI003B9AD27E